jgi:GNAT superfamily N-acetyltransferase
MQIRRIDPGSERDVSHVARNMRQTLIEVLGPDAGASMYSLDWLVHRVLWHCDPAQCTGEVVVAEHDTAGIIGHTIIRIEREDGLDVGLISTTYVQPDHRRRSIATALLSYGESWMLARDLAASVTYTDANNAPLIAFYQKFGYGQSPMPDNFLRLHRALRPSGDRIELRAE